MKCVVCEKELEPGDQRVALSLSVAEVSALKRQSTFPPYGQKTWVYHVVNT